MRLSRTVAIIAVATICNLHAKQLESIKAFQSVESYQVTSTANREWDSSVSFGNWHTANPEQNPAPGFGLTILGLPSEHQIQGYQLTITDGQQWQHLECLVRGHLAKIVHWPMNSNTGQKPALACGIKGISDAAFYLTPQWDQQFVGHTELSDRSIKIRSLHFLEKTAYPALAPAGYLLTDEQGAIAQVEVVSDGRVWFRPGLTAQTQLELAARITALLLFKPKNS